MDFPVDFVITWVDGNDRSWLKKKKKALGITEVEKESVEECRFVSNDEIRFRRFSG